MATILNGRPSHILADAGRDRSKFYCPICSLTASRLRLVGVSTRLPEERDPEGGAESRKAFVGTKVGGTVPGTHRAVAVALACECGAQFDVLVIPNERAVGFALLLGGDE